MEEADDTASLFGPPVDLRPRFSDERRRLLALLDRLAPSDWQRPTSCPGWTVRDLAAHLLGDDLGRLARSRDADAGVAPRPGEPFPAFIDRINQEWVVAARRLSARVLQDALAWTGPQIADLWAATAMHALGEPVSWAGPQPAPAWLDAARDHTEYWVHRRQIAEAVGAADSPAATELGEVVDVFARALPHSLRAVGRPGDTLTLAITGVGGGRWSVARGPLRWVFSDVADPDATVRMDADTFWRLCCRNLSPPAAAARIQSTGDRLLTDAVGRIVAIITDQA